jgi:GNAT superfamily N-acetyltransferase
VDRPDEPARPAGDAPRIVELDPSHDEEIDPLLALARAGASGGGLLAAVGSDVDADLALDWWLRATRLPRLGWSTGDRVAAFAVAAPPDARLPPWARLRWFASAARRDSPERAWRLLQRLAASERHHPSAPHFCVPVLAVHPDPGGADVARRLLEAVQERSAAHPASTGVCCETGDAEALALLESFGFRPAARFSTRGVRQNALFRPDAAAPFADPVVVPIEDSIDLHRFHPAEIADVVAGYVEAAREAGFREVRIIHGRGKGVQRHRVQRLLARDPRVERFSDAPADRGGRGATLAWLSPRKGQRH